MYVVFLIYLNFILDDKAKLKLGGFKYAKRIESTTRGDGALKLRSDRLQFAAVVYSIHSGRDFTRTAIDDIEFHQRKAFDQNLFRSHLASHLVRVIKTDPRLNTSDLLSHPYFWTVQQMSFFEIRIRSFSAVFHDFDKLLESRRDLVFAGKWSDKLSPAVKKACVYPKGSKGIIMEDTFMGLALARRNRNQHRDDDDSEVQEEMRTIPVENFLYWEGLFPTFFTYLFINSLKFYKKTRNRLLYLEPEFSEFFRLRLGLLLREL